MIKKFEKPIDSRLDQIIREAEDRLHYFYKTYGEWDGKGKKSTKKKKSIDREDDTLDQDLFLENSLPDRTPNKTLGRTIVPSKTKKINRPYVLEVVPEVIPPIAVDLPKNNEVSFEGLSSREIIEKVKTITGVAITVCVKSKINVIRHAVIILKEKGFDVKM